MELKKHKFDCGCEFDIVNEQINPNTGLPSIDLDFERIRYDCPKTWELYQKGDTKGIFQLETRLGQAWSKKTLPNDVEDVAALISAIRPGVLKAIVDGKSMAEHFADRKLGKEEITVLDENLKEILSKTYGTLIFQEQAIQIVQKLAGFSLKDADILRRAMGKKEADTMTEVENMFAEGCKKIGLVSEEKAKEIFSWIRKSERYSFNASHAVSYATIGYQSAYIKAHFPLIFFTIWLKYAKDRLDPQQEIRELLSEAQKFQIKINKPSLSLLKNSEDFICYNKEIYFGVRNIKRIGTAVADKLSNIIDEKEKLLNKSIEKFSWYEFLINIGSNVNKTAIRNLILAGSLDHLKISRQEMLHEFSIWSEFTDREKEYVLINNTKSLMEAIDILLLSNKPNIKRRAILESLRITLLNPPNSLEDRAAWINKIESDLFGVPLTYSSLDGLDTLDANANCQELSQENGLSKAIICAEIKEVRENTVKKGPSKGEKMAFLKVEDNSGVLENIVVFTKEWVEYKNLLYPYNTITLCLSKTKKSSYMVMKAKQI